MASDLSASDDGSLLFFFGQHGCTPVETPILQPAALFLDLSGEDIRRRLFLTGDGDGQELCLRPEHTIPVCRRHLAGGWPYGAYCYQGPVFRQRPGLSGEFSQAGFELLGDPDPARADARALGLALDALARFGPAFDVRLGDMGLLRAVIDALALPAGAARRLMRDLAAGQGPAGQGVAGQGFAGSWPGRLDRPGANGDGPVPYAGLLAAIAGQDPGAARAFIADVMAIAGVAPIGGRSAAEIADRFLAQAENRTRGVGPEAHAVLLAYAGQAGPPDVVLQATRDLAAGAGLAIAPALDAFERRRDAFAAAGIDGDRLVFRADFVRTLDYYTGLIFEARRPGESVVVAAGGRYDDLLIQLGSPAPVPAVGCAFWIDRLSGAAS